jgi:hypothetical protein
MGTEEIERKRKRIGFRWVGGVSGREARESRGCSWARGPEVEGGRVLELVETGRRRRSWRPAAEGLLLAFGLGETREEGLGREKHT